MRYLRGEIRRQRAHPRDGLLAALIHAEEAGDALTDDELLAMAFLLLAAGHETTLHQIACSVLTLLDCPEQRRELTSDWSILGPAVEELLRHVAFAQVAKPRYARQDTVFYGQAIRRGQLIFACLASANADPAYFHQPERLDLTRHGQRHLAFGSGIHYCLGAPLASMETQMALQRLFTRFPTIHLAVPRERIRYSRRPGTRGLEALPVKW
jgi:cytochrome P450 PksS